MNQKFWHFIFLYLFLLAPAENHLWTSSLLLVFYNKQFELESERLRGFCACFQGDSSKAELKQSWATLAGPRVELFLHCHQKLLHVMSYLLASSKRQKCSSSKEKHNPNQTIFLLFSEHHPQICSFWFIFLMFGHTCRIPYAYHRETQAGF